MFTWHNVLSRIDDSDLVGYEVYCFYESRISRFYRWRKSLWNSTPVVRMAGLIEEGS